jgi:starch-binding outer membrane protein, SusD/RagB family
MKKVIYISIPLLALVCGLQSCNSDYESVPVEQFTEDFVFSETDSIGDKAKSFLNAIYSTIPSGRNRVGGDYLDAAADDAVSSSLGQTNVDNLAAGNYTSMTRIESDMIWGTSYNAIRRVNIFIRGIDRVPLKYTYNDGQPMTRAWKAEAKFIRAYHYFELIKRYGGVPVMDDAVLDLDDDVELPRRNFSDCVEYIVSELDAIKDSLRVAPVPNAQTDSHVITKGAAMALKSRVLLYAASPLFNGGNIGAGNELTGYTDSSQERWKRASDAARDFIVTQTYYGLQPSFSDVFITENSPEIIFFRANYRSKDVEKENGPIGYSAPNNANGRTSPSQNLVEAFPMLDGKAINDPASSFTYNINNQYANRDPRLNLTVLHDGSQWLNEEVQTYVGGKDNPNTAIQKTKTSYYLRKFMGHYETADDYQDIRQNWNILRYAEILLNFAEAENEYSGPTAEVYQVLTQLRARAGILAGADNLYGFAAGMSKDQMREAIHIERRIEMAFEEQRYWDIRRWKTAQQVYSQPVRGLQIALLGGVKNYNVITVRNTTFDERRYLYPIPYSEVVKNSQMVQNPGW